MHTVELIADAIKSEYIPVTDKIYSDKICCVTGIMQDCIDRKKGIGSSFTNQSLMCSPDSEYLGIRTWQVLKHRPERSAWLVTDREFRHLTRIEIRPLVLDGIKAATWAGYATTSYKKHGSLVAPVNSGNNRIWRFEGLTVDCSDLEKVNSIYVRLVDTLKAGIGRSVIESLDIPPFLIKKVGVRIWLDFEAWARPIFKSNLYQFLCYLLPSQEELKAAEKKEIKGQAGLFEES